MNIPEVVRTDQGSKKQEGQGQKRSATTMRRRFLYLIGELHTGGSERQLCYLLGAMDRDRYKPAVAVWNFSESAVHVPSIRALNVPLYGLVQGHSRLHKLAALRKLVTKLQPEVVHSWSFYTNFAAHYAALGSRSLAIGSIRSDFSWALKQCGPLVGNISARWPTRQICNSYSAAQNIPSSRKYFRPLQVSVVRNAVDLKQFHNTPVPNNNPIRILGIGYLLPVKRWDWLLSAVELLKQRRIACEVQIAGNGPMRRDLEHLALSLGIADRIKFLGHVDDVPKLIASANFVVHTGDSEGCPNAVMEAMACGRAVVATDAGDIPYLVEDGETGFVVNRGDWMALADRIARLTTDVNLCSIMGRSARVRAESEFSLDRLVTETLATYRLATYL